jgi:hypothetical protein
MWKYRDKNPEQTKKLRKVRIFTIGKYRFAADHYNKYKDEILKRTPAGNWLHIGSESTVWMRMIDKDSCLIDKYIPLSELLKME